MRIAHFVQRYPPALGGSEAYFARLTRFLDSAGDTITVFTSDALDLEAFWSPKGASLVAGKSMEGGVEVRRYSLWRARGRKFLLKPLSLFPNPGWQCLTLPCNPISAGMWNDARREALTVDLVHATSLPYAWPIVCARMLARRIRVPFLLTPFMHLGDPDDPDDPTRRAYTSRPLLSLVRSADAVFVQTEGEKRMLLSLGIAAERLVLLGMGVEPDECTGGNRGQARAEWGAGDGEVVVGHLANNSREKGTADLLLAANRAWEHGHAFRVVLAGPVMPNFLRFWNTYQPAGPVIRLGRLTEDQKRDFFAGIDVHALPSRSDSFGLVLLEAWANRVPNLAYRAGGLVDVIHDSEDGLLVPCGNIAQLASELTRLVTDAALRTRLGETGFGRIGREFRWGPILSRVRVIYQEMAARRPSEPRLAAR